MPLPFFSYVGTASCAVASILLISTYYRQYLRKQGDREHTLRERVTYMLWVMAEQI